MEKKNKIMRAAAVSAVLAFGITFSGCAAGCGRFIGGQASPSSAGTESGSTAGNPSNPGQTDEHSEIVNNLLYDEYYVNLKYKLVEKNGFITKEMLPIPYQFLREEDKDVDAYLDGTLNAFASSYMYNDDKNHLYVSVKAENKSYSEYGNYYTNYVLKYPLTNQESEEFLYLCKGKFLQGLLFIQELDIQKNPEILSKINIAKTSYEKMTKEYQKINALNLNGYNNITIDVYDMSLDDVEISIRGSTVQSSAKQQIGFVHLHPISNAGIVHYDNNAWTFMGPTNAEFINYETYPASIKNITSFGYGPQIKNSNPYHAFDIQK